MNNIEKIENNTIIPSKSIFSLNSSFTPTGDQPEAIKELVSGIQNDEKDQVLLGVTGSGKTFTMANIINSLNRPSLIMAPNKTLAAQLYAEMKDFFPNNAVEYFVSYYDYYQPEPMFPDLIHTLKKNLVLMIKLIACVILLQGLFLKERM